MANLDAEQGAQTANTAPGITFMAKGAHGWVKDGKLLRKEEPGAKLAHFPPHWMISWPFDSKTSGFPDCASAPDKLARSGITCIAEDGSPSAFMVIYEDKVEIQIEVFAARRPNMTIRKTQAVNPTCGTIADEKRFEDEEMKKGNRLASLRSSYLAVTNDDRDHYTWKKRRCR